MEWRKFYAFEPVVMNRNSGVRLTPGAVCKHPDNPLLKGDRPWEQSMDNIYPNVIYDGVKYRCWYGVFLKDPVREYYGDRFHEAPNSAFYEREHGLCYAESIDGITWHKPALGLCEYNGDRQNNIVLEDAHGVGVSYNPDAEWPGRRYRLVMQKPKKGMYVAWSPDGLHWEDWRKVSGQMHNNIFRSNMGEDFLVTRIKTAHSIRWKEKHGKHAMVRRIGVCATVDYVNWEHRGRVFSGGYRAQPYSLVAHPLSVGFLGFVSVIDEITGHVESRLAHSYNGCRWRLLRSKPLIPNDTSYDKSCIFVGPPLQRDGRLRLYYGASAEPHNHRRDGVLALATIGADRYMALEPKGDKPRRVKTAPINIRPMKAMHVTADVDDGGFLECSVLKGRRVLAVSENLGISTTNGLLLFKEQVPEARSATLSFRLYRSRLFSFGEDEETSCIFQT